MEVPLYRQAKIIQIMEDFLEKWTTYDLLRGRLSQAERELMFGWMDKLKLQLNLSNILGQENGKMAYQATIVQKLEDQKVPEEFVNLAAGTNDGFIGYAFVEDGELQTGTLDGGEQESLTTLKETMDAMSMHMSFTFAKGADSDESKQPFNTLQDARGNCICATFIEGELQGFDAPESSHSVEHNAHQQYMAPKLLDIYQSCNEDIGKVVEKLNSNFTKREILANCFSTTTARGEILLVFANGQTVNIVKGDKHQKYGWGEVSQALGYGGKAIEEKVEPPKKNLLGKGGSKPADKPVLSLPKATSTVEEGKKLTQPTAISAAIDDAKDNLEYMIIPPAIRFDSFKNLQTWYKAFGHKDQQPSDDQINEMVKKPHTAIAVKVKSDMKNKGFNIFLEKNTILMTDSKAKAPAATKPETKITPAILSAADRETFNETIMPKMVKALQNYDDGSRLVLPPERMSEFLKDKPLLTEQLGLQEGLDQFNSWSAEAFEQLATKLPFAAGMLMQQLVYDRMKTSMALKEATKIKKAM